MRLPGRMEQLAAMSSPPNPPNQPNPADSSSTDPRRNSGSDGSETPISSLPTQPATIAPYVEMPAFIGPYRVIAFLGRGGQGSVYRAVHPALGRDVVIKLASRELSAVQQECLFAEGRVLAGLDDPGLIRVYDANVHENRPYVVFEYVQGRSLAEQVRGTSLPTREAVALVAELAEIVERVHRAGVLHRDLKPTNILIDSEGNPRLMDFGSSLLTAPYTDTIAEEEYSGTPSYMSPEQANGLADRVGPGSDVFGLGAVLYHLLTGSPLYQGTDSRSVWNQARAGSVRSVTERNPAVSPTLVRILDRALANDPAARYKSAGEFGRALRGYLRRRSRRIAAIFAMLALLCVCAAVLVIQPWKDRDVAPPPTQQPGQHGPVVREMAPRPRFAGWREYTPGDGYAILFPDEPKPPEVEVEGQRQVVAREAHTGTWYSVAVSSYRDPKATPQAAVRARRDEILALLGGVLTREGEISHARYPGVDATGFVPTGFFQGHWVRLQVFLVGDHFYTLGVMGRDPPHRPEETDVTWFLESFRLLAPGGGKP